MSIEAMKLAAEFNRYFTSANGVDVSAKVSVTRDEWRVLFNAIQQAEAQQPATTEPVAWMASYVDPVGNDHVYVTSHRDLAVENDMHGEPKPLYTRPAPSVPADVVRDAERYRWLRKADRWPCVFPDHFDPEPLAGSELDECVDAAMLAAKDSK